MGPRKGQGRGDSHRAGSGLRGNNGDGSPHSDGDLCISVISEEGGEIESRGRFCAGTTGMGRPAPLSECVGEVGMGLHSMRGQGRGDNHRLCAGTTKMGPRIEDKGRGQGRGDSHGVAEWAHAWDNHGEALCGKMGPRMREDKGGRGWWSGVIEWAAIGQKRS